MTFKNQRSAYFSLQALIIYANALQDLIGVIGPMFTKLLAVIFFHGRY